jgi:uncharacterized membrane protein
MSAPVRTPKFSTREALRFGWRAARRFFGFFVTMFIVTSIVDGIPSQIQFATRESAPLISALAGLLAAAISIVVSIGWTKVLLRIADGERPDHSDLYAHHALLFRYLGASLLYVLSIIAGTILLIIPGILAAVRYSMASFLVVDRGMGPLEAMRKSAEITKGERMHLFIAGLALGGFTLLGALALVIGLLWTLPAAMVAGAFIYRRLSPREPDAGAPAPAPAGGPKEWWASAR